MDWADDVAYAVHDVEDFYRAGLIPLDRLAVDSEERSRIVEAEWQRSTSLRLKFKDRKQDIEQAFDQILGIAPFVAAFSGSRSDRARIRAFTSTLVSRYIGAVSLDRHDPKLNINPDFVMEVAILKGLTWQYVIESRPLLTQRHGHRRLIASLFNVLMDAGLTPNDHRIFPEEFREMLVQDQSKEAVVRTVADLIASLTEERVVALHHRLTGISMGASLDPILP